MYQSNSISPLVGLIQTLFIIALACVIVYKYADLRTKNSHFVCPRCGSCFKLSKASFILALKWGLNLRYVTCPDCGYKGWMHIVND